jgi:hypothetical protein
MGMYEGSAQLGKAMRLLTNEWNQAKEAWNDEKRAAFEERYIVTVQQDTRHAIETMAHMATLLDQIRRECSDRRD